MASREPAPFFQLRPLTRRERVLLVATVLLMWAVGFVFWIYQPFTERVTVLKKQMEDERAKLESARAILHQLDAIETKIAELTASMEELDLLVPGDNRAANFLYSCWEWEGLTGAKVLSMTFQAPKEGQGYEEYVVNFSVAGTYEAQVKFLARIEDMNRLVRVDSVSLLPVDPFGSSNEGGSGQGSTEGGDGTAGGGAGSLLPTSDIVTAEYSVHLFVDPAKAAAAAQEAPGEGLIFTLRVGRKTPFLP